MISLVTTPVASSAEVASPQLAVGLELAGLLHSSHPAPSHLFQRKYEIGVMHVNRNHKIKNGGKEKKEAD